MTAGRSVWVVECLPRNRKRWVLSDPLCALPTKEEAEALCAGSGACQYRAVEYRRCETEE